MTTPMPIAERLEVLRQVEWNGDWNYCPLCWGGRNSGHSPHCRVARLILDVEAEQATPPEPSERERRLVEALEPFVTLSNQRDATYRKRGGNPESFPDSHPAYDITAHQLRLSVWRCARAALGAYRQPAATDQGEQG